VLRLLQEKSQRARDSVKAAIVEETLQSKKAKQALRLYLRKWEDTTRPGVVSLACEAVGGNPDKVVALQTALLFVDAAMDIHDDVLDKSVRKGAAETVYGRFGEETALLLGNAFLVKGFNHIYRITEGLPSEKRLWIVDSVKDFLFEVISAHVTESGLCRDKWSVRPKQYVAVLRQKAADIEGHMRIGAIFGFGKPAEIEALAKYGRNLGFLLAVRSDFVDVFELDELANRVRNECLPLPLLYLLRSPGLKKKIRGILDEEKISESEAGELVEMIWASREVAKLKESLGKVEKEAASCLSVLRPNSAKKTLLILVEAMLEDL
jgi:geranylgeranyl diphosphate synthase type I